MSDSTLRIKVLEDQLQEVAMQLSRSNAGLECRDQEIADMKKHLAESAREARSQSCQVEHMASQLAVAQVARERVGDQYEQVPCMNLLIVV